MHRITRRRTVVAIGCVAALAIASVAYAYFTSTGSGTATAKVGTSSAVTLTGITVDAGHSTCSVTISGGNPDFSMPAVAVNATFGPGNGQAVTPKGTLTMNDTGVNQNACQGAELTLALSSN